MANIYPIKEDLSEVPFAELKVYEALEKLGKNFYIFHSVQWLKKTKKWAATWKESLMYRHLQYRSIKNHLVVSPGIYL